MQDTKLWRLLGEPCDADQLTPLLQKLSAAPLRERFAFFGSLDHSLASPKPELRAAALSVLCGANGHGGWLRLAAGLDDDEEIVRHRAAEALADSCREHDPARIVHALFHPRVDNRRAALDQIQDMPVGWYALYLADDPQLAEEAQLAVCSQPSRPAALPVIIDLHQRGKLPIGVATSLIFGMHYESEQEFLAAHAARSPERTELILDHLMAGIPLDVDPSSIELHQEDILDSVLDLMWQDVLESGSASRAAAWLEQLSGSLMSRRSHRRTQAVIRRFTVSMFFNAKRHRRWIVPALRWCALFFPVTLGCRCIDRALRRDAVQTLYASGRRMQLLAEELTFLLNSDLGRRKDGHLDLWALGGLLTMAEHPYEMLLQTFGENRLVAAFLSDLEGSCPLFSLPDTKDNLRLKLIDTIRRRRRTRSDFFSALLIYSLSADGYDFLERLSPREALAVVEELFHLDTRPELKLSPNKLTVAGRYLSARLASAPGDFLSCWLRRKEPASHKIGLEILGNLSSGISAEQWVQLTAALSIAQVRRLLPAIEAAAGFPYGHELALARHLCASPDNDLADWGRQRAPEAPPVAAVMSAPPPTVEQAPGAALTDKQRQRIASASHADLARALAPCLQQPLAGVAEALGRRLLPGSGHLEACCALLGCFDPLAEVDAQLVRFAGPQPPKRFVSRLDSLFVATWQGRGDLSLLGHACLWRWERHSAAFADQAAAQYQSLAGLLEHSQHWSCVVLRERIWQAGLEVLMQWKFRNRSQFAEGVTEPLLRAAVAALASSVGHWAAKLLMHVFDAGVHAALLDPLRAEVEEQLPDLDDSLRRVLQRWVNSRGLVGIATANRSGTPLTAELRKTIASSIDVDQLLAWCLDAGSETATEAALRLTELGAAAQRRLAALLLADTPPACLPVIAETIVFWETEPLPQLRAWLASGTGDIQRTFHLAVSLAERGELEFLPQALDAAGQEGNWFRRQDWARLLATDADVDQIASALVVSPQPNAYTQSVQHFLQSPDDDDFAVRQLARFLECGSQRMATLRLEAAARLLRAGDDRGLCIVMRGLAGQETRNAGCLRGLSLPAWRRMIDAVLMAGDSVFPERLLYKILQMPELDQEAFDYGMLQLTANAQTEQAQQAAARQLRGSHSRQRKLRVTAETFHWGIRVGRELTGRLFRVEMIGGSDLGYTRLNEDAIFINPMPIFAGERHAEDIVQGLILHEIGHHMYHRGEAEAEIWKQAQDEGLGGLLNLVADEHLERNLRARDTDFGNKIKRLGAYAFQHARREMPIEQLLDCLRAQSLPVLQGNLRVARQKASVGVEAGRVLLEAERQGMSFPRFFRALRMGLGNRFGDPLVGQGLALFDKPFRHADMPRLLDISRQLRDIFHREAKLIDAMNQDRLVASSESDLLCRGEGITNEQLQSEIRRVDRAEDLTQPDTPAVSSGRWINVIPTEDFETIDRVTPMPYRREQHKRYADLVRGPALRLRRFLDELGVRLTPQSRRLRGTRLGRPQLSRLVVQRDPRVLVARQRQVVTDLFLSVLVDCSGSMEYADHMERAKRFGMLVAEAARGVAGIDVRLFGFTDSEIYDAGTALRPAVPQFAAGGGNNDAAALWHAAQLALQSRRQAKLIVMISDGLPTECSVAALTKLVNHLSRRLHICCAQAAVQPLEDICFPHYVLLNDGDMDRSVREFGTLIARLVRKAIR